MFKIDRPENISPMKSFFVGNNIPSKPIIYAILNGRNPGNIWIDDTNSPSRILIVSNAGYSFYSGSLSNLAVKNVINCCKQNTNIKLAVTLNQLEKIIKIYPDFDIIERTQLSFKNDHKSLKKIINNHVSNINFHKIKTSKLFNQCMWYNVMLEMYGSEDNFINNGIGFCLINNENEILAEAYVGYLSEQSAEIGWVTNPKYRRKGFGKLISGYLTNYLISRNVYPIATCDSNNLASRKVAINIGMKEDFKYYFLKVK